MARAEQLAEHQARIEAFTEFLLRPYIDCLPEELGGSQKEFNDPIWGTVYLRAHELAVLDSPLVQRLRRIKQLGVVHYVYPAATHSRLEHSLGVVHQVQRMITSLNDRGFEGHEAADSAPIISPALEDTLRMAALCHDVGHGFMSHVSEYALSANRQCEDLQLEFQGVHQRPSLPQLSEMAAFYMVGSPAFKELIEKVYSRTHRALPIDFAHNLQRLIMGRPLSEELILLHEFISGPFDADKLDYYARDAFMCGIPNVTDIPRLIQKLRAARVGREGLPTGLRQGVDNRQQGYIVTGIATSGGRTLDELALARTLLYDKVYRHQKVRAIESMVFRLVERLTELADFHPTELLYELNDDEVLHLTEARVSGLIRRDLTPADSDAISTVLDLSSRLRDRQLFSRGFAFASVMTDDDYRHDPAQGAGLQAFLSAAGSRPEHVTGQIIEKLVEIASALEFSLQVTGERLADYVLLSPPKTSSSQQNSDTGNAQLIESDGKVTPFADDAAETTPWTNAYIATRDLGHVFCPAEIAPLVFVATETVLLCDYGVHVPRTMLHYAKQKEAKVETVRIGLETAGWFDGKPPELRPLPQALREANAPDRIERVSQNMRGYWGPLRAAAANESVGPAGTIGPTQVETYARQFAEGGSSLVDPALAMLEKMRLVGRSDASRAISEFIEEHIEFRGAFCAPLGSHKDSSSVLTYLVNDVADNFGLITGSIQSAVSSGRPILFVDDFIGTGRQTVDIFQAWLGAERTEDLDEEREALPPDVRELLASRSLGLVFAAATSDGLNNVDEKLGRQLSLDIKAHVGIRPDDLPRLSNLSELDNFDSLIEFLSTKGGELLMNHGGKIREQTWIDARRLGYGNAGYLVASAFNTPTAALTALWAESGNWNPLLPRRTKR